MNQCIIIDFSAIFITDAIINEYLNDTLGCVQELRLDNSRVHFCIYIYIYIYT